MVDRRDARLDHLECRIERVQIRVDAACSQAVGNPKLELLIGTAELDGCHTDMMMAIDETGHDDMTAVTQDLVRLVATGETLVGANLDDLAIALEDRAVLDDFRTVVIVDSGDDVFTTDYR